MKKIAIGLLALVLLGSMFSSSASARMKKLGQAGMTWLTIDASARAAGIGGAFNNIKGDPGVLFYNPAGLAQITRGAFIVNYTSWLAEMAVTDLAVAYKLGEYGVFGLSFRFMDYGDITGTVIDEQSPAGYRKTGNVDTGAFSVGFAYARELTNRFSLGVHAKYASQSLGETEIWKGGSATGKTTKNEVSTADGGAPWMAFDLGFAYDTGIKSLRISSSVRNFSKQLLYQDERFQLPLTFNIGISANPVDFIPGVELPEAHDLLLTLDGTDPRDRPEDVSFGIEYTLMDMLSLRMGRRAGSQSDGKFCAGVGFKLDIGEIGGRVDYAYTNFGDILGDVHRISLQGFF